MADEEKSRRLMSAVIHINPTEMREAGVTHPSAMPLLMSARRPLEKLLEEDPNSKIAGKLRALLDEHMVFYLVGPWPPLQGQKPPISNQPQKVCGECGRILP